MHQTRIHVVHCKTLKINFNKSLRFYSKILLLDRFEDLDLSKRKSNLDLCTLNAQTCINAQSFKRRRGCLASIIFNCSPFFQLDYLPDLAYDEPQSEDDGDDGGDGDGVVHRLRIVYHICECYLQKLNLHFFFLLGFNFALLRLVSCDFVIHFLHIL